MVTRRPICRGAVIVALALACSGCVSGERSPPSARSAAQHRAVITVGSFDFPENVLLAHIYAGALAARGYPVHTMANLGSRELVDPALLSGLIQLVPEYAGSALEFTSLGRLSATSSVAATTGALTRSVAGAGLLTGRPAAAQDSNAIVVTAATAARYHLRSIADLASVAPRLVFGGPPECPGRAYCLPGLRHVYGVRFRAFIPLDAGGPLTLQALSAGDVDAALLFSTNPSIRAGQLVALTDDRGLQPAENIIPLLRRDVVARFGTGVLTVLNAVSARLDTRSLRALDALVQLDGQSPGRVAAGWLRGQGLAAQEAASR